MGYANVAACKRFHLRYNYYSPVRVVSMFELGALADDLRVLRCRLGHTVPMQSRFPPQIVTEEATPGMVASNLRQPQPIPNVGPTAPMSLELA